ncbi:hypothetical protein A2W32_02750 [candidate division WWE3 bacterium RBG_16_37_10]|uniref:SIMPL domain-containing protein n=1 Tax=candidate division WWE3 bacterium RBG_16_37_10 TaxID=1802610 RepID=A0A1F4V3F3_UNCKA|nr:MAG: hypothetical protein A2W32_02750 [candidate division WWE3 bacterium RBG_16_37_10]
MQQLRQIVLNHKPYVFTVLVLATFITLSTLGFIKIGTVKIEADQTITVTGSSEKQKKNERATYSAGITVTNAEKAKAVSEANEKSSRITQAVKQFGIPQEDMKTSNINVMQDQESYYDNGILKYRPGNWRVNINIEIVLKDIKRIDDLTNLLTSLESTDLYGPNLSLDSSNEDESVLLAAALENAREKADALAQSSGRRLGKLVSVVEGFSQSIYPISYYAKAGGMGGGGAEIEPGTTTLSKMVTATFRLE